MDVRWRTLISRVVLVAAIGRTMLYAQSAEPLSLTDAESRALQNHPQIRGAQYGADAAAQSVKQVRSLFFPTVAASITGAQAEAGSRIAAGGLNNPVILDRFSTGFSMSQLLTDFGRTHELVAGSTLRADGQQQAVEGRRAEVRLQVQRAYFGALRAKAVAQVAEETVKARQIVVDQVSALAASGLKSGLDLSFAKVNLAEAQLLLVQSRNDVEAAFATLSAAMGESAVRVYDLADEPLPAQPPSDPADLIAHALRDRPDLAAQRLANEAAGRFAAAESTSWMPSVSLAAAAGMTPYRQSGLTSRYSAVGVTVTMPVSSGGLLSARRAEAGLRSLAEEQRVRDLENVVARDVRMAWLDAQTAFLKLDLAEQLRAQAADAADLAQARYDIGLGSIVELGQAQLNKTRADIENAAARYDYQLRTAALRFQIGAP